MDGDENGSEAQAFARRELLELRTGSLSSLLLSEPIAEALERIIAARFGRPRHTVAEVLEDLILEEADRISFP